MQKISIAGFVLSIWKLILETVLLLLPDFFILHFLHVSVSETDSTVRERQAGKQMELLFTARTV